MKKKLFLLLMLIAGTYLSNAQHLKASLDYSAYATSSLEPYIEFIFIIGGQSVSYIQDEKGLYHAAVEISIEFEKDDAIVDKIHYILDSDAYQDTLKNNKMDFADIVNHPIENGKYILHFLIKDLNNPDNKLQYIDNLDVLFPKDKVSLSRLSLLSSISQASENDFYIRHGLNVPPMPLSFYNKNSHALPFISEIYNTDKVLAPGKEISVKCNIRSIDNPWLNLSRFSVTKSYPTAPVVIIVDQIDISSLPSGNYNLTMEVFEDDSILLASTMSFFQRSNPDAEVDINAFSNVVIDNSFVSKYTDLKDLQEYVACLYPIGTNLEQEFFNKRVNKMSREDLQVFFYNFWLTRAPENPEKAWLEYYEKVKHVNEVYGNKTVKGYRTDRGRVFLRYGPPNSLRESPFSPALYPYEVWHYYYLDGESNVKFVFVNTDFVSKDYELYHSTKRGEPKDPLWQRKLVRDRRGIDNWDETKPTDFWGNDMDDIWENP